jgi:thiamine pyrophosphokinase
MPSKAEDTVLVIAGGIGPGELTDAAIPAAGSVIAADSGAVTAFELGLHVDELVGDLDSASAELQARVREAGGQIDRHPEVKDATDLELALAAAVTREPQPKLVVVLCGAGGRLDHAFGGIQLLASPSWAGADSTGVRVEARLGRAKITVIRGRAVLEAAAPGELVSLFAVGGTARGVTASGLLYELRGLDLAEGSSRGVSNEFTAPQAVVEVAEGVLLAIQPGETGTHYLRHKVPVTTTPPGTGSV